ncbi:MAG: molybdate ABC transporter permease subunit [Peptostreptococcaceae bacterium]
MKLIMIISALKISFEVTTISVLISFLISIVVIYSGKRNKLVETLMLLPIFIPPSAVGYMILMFFSRNNIIGKTFSDFGVEVIFSKLGAIIVSIIVTLPIMYQTISTATRSIDKDLINAAKICGSNKLDIFINIILPLSKNSILTAFILSFARSFGEFGATILVAGNIEGKTQTLPMLLYFFIESSQTQNATIVLFIIIIISISMIYIYKKLQND